MTIKYFINNLLIYEIVPSILISVICYMSIYILYKNKITIKEMRKYFLISFMVGIVIFIGSYSIILPILSIITIIQLKNNEDKIRIKILIMIYSIYFINTIYGIVYTFLGQKIFKMSFKYFLIEFVILFIIIVFICLIINNRSLKRKAHIKISQSQIRLRMILAASIPVTFIMLIIYLTIDIKRISRDKIDFLLGNFVPAALPLISIILVSIIIYYYDRSVEYRVKLKREAEEKCEIEEYTHIIENMYGETRKFKHDYINMISSLKEYIDNREIENLKKFFYDNIVDMDRNIRWNNSNIDKLKYIKDMPALKGLISTKLINALSMNIDIEVDMIENINDISMNIMDLCRILGILMDNCIEAAEECIHSKIWICMVNKNDHVVIVLKNNFLGKKPAIYDIYNKGFSTKGQDRGLGLYNVRCIIDSKYENVFLNTSIEDKIFIQELWIKDEKRMS